MTSEDVKRVLHLQPHPREGGWYKRTWEAAEPLPPEAFLDRRYAGPRPTSTAIYYLLEADAFSPMHVLKSDEIFHHYLGDAVEMLQLLPDGSSQRVILGSEIASGQRPQWVVRRGVWQGCRLLREGSGGERQNSGLLGRGSGLSPGGSRLLPGSSGLASQGSGLAPADSGLAPSLGWALLGCTVSPGFEFEDYEEARAEDLLARWPQPASLIRALTHG